MGRQVGEPKLVRGTKLRITGASWLRHFQEAERDRFADCWRNCAAIHPVFLEIFVCNRQFAVIGAAVIHVLKLDCRADRLNTR